MLASAPPSTDQLARAEAQLLALARHQVQAEAQARQRTPLAFQRLQFDRAHLAQCHQRLEIGRADGAQGDPAQRLQVAQTTRAFLQVRLEVVRGIAEARVAAKEWGDRIMACMSDRYGVVLATEATALTRQMFEMRDTTPYVECMGSTGRELASGSESGIIAGAITFAPAEGK